MLNNFPDLDVKSLFSNDERNEAQQRTGWRILYPFGLRQYDIPIIDQPNHETQVDLDFNFPFYGFRFNYSYITPNGLLKFSTSDWIQPPYDFPNPKWPFKKDPSFIAPLLSRATFQYVGRKKISNVWYRTIHREKHFCNRKSSFTEKCPETKRKLQPGYVEDDAFLDRLTRDVERGIIGASGFNALHAMIVTWERMAFGGAPKIVQSENHEIAKQWQNTFQTVLLTDEIRSYVLLNYEALNWTSSTEAGSLRGRGGYQSAIAGFNAGNGTGFTPMPYSGEGEINKLAIYSPIGLPGRWLFRVDEEILAGGCSNESAGHMTIAPDRVSMLGGAVVNVSGPCVMAHQTVHVLFEDMLVKCDKLNMHRARCLLPTFLRVGLISAKFSVDGGRMFPFTGSFYVVPIDLAVPGVILRTDIRQPFVNSFDNPTPEKLTLTWSAQNLTGDPNAKITIDLLGYWEDADGHRLERVGVIAERIENTGSYTFVPKELPPVTNLSLMNKWQNYELGVVRVLVPDDPAVGMLHSKVTGLSWYFVRDWQKNYGDDWAIQRCIEWFDRDGKWRNFWMDLDPCPCTLDQALLDFGRFMPYFECDMNGDGACYYHRGASHCVMSSHATWSSAQSVCCYDGDGWLMHSDDYDDLEITKYYSSGIPYRAHMHGSYPYRLSPYVPTLSNWFHDLAPYHMCCRFANQCSFLLWRRQTRSCQGYQPPTAGFAYGTGQMITFDDTHYRFNGRGYYILTMSGNPRHRLKVQVRMEQPPKTPWHVHSNSSIITGVAAQENDSDVVEIYSRTDLRKWRYATDVYVAGTRRFFDTPDLKFQQFQGFNIYNPLRNYDQSTIYIQFRSGAGIRVTEHSGALEIGVTLPPSYNFSEGTDGTKRMHTFGMLSGYGGISDQKLTGNTARTGNVAEAVNSHFQNWQVDGASDSAGPLLFQGYSRPLSNLLLFSQTEPVASESIRPLMDQYMHDRAVKHVCGSNHICRQTFLHTGNIEYARHVMEANKNFVSLKRAGTKSWISCGPVYKQPGMMKYPQGNNYLDGVTVTLSCPPGMYLHGAVKRTCENGLWSPGWPAWCRNSKLEEGLKIFTGVVTSFGLLSIIITIFSLCYRFNVRPRHREMYSSFGFKNPCVLPWFERMANFASLSKATSGVLWQKIRQSRHQVKQ